MSSYIPQTSKHKLHTRKYIHTLQQRHKCVVPQDSRRAISAAQHIPLHPFTGAFTNAPPPTAREPPARLLWGAAPALCRCRFRVCVCVCVRERESERSYYSAKTTTNPMISVTTVTALTKTSSIWPILHTVQPRPSHTVTHLWLWSLRPPYISSTLYIPQTTQPRPSQTPTRLWQQSLHKLIPHLLDIFLTLHSQDHHKPHHTYDHSHCTHWAHADLIYYTLLSIHSQDHHRP